MDEQHPPLSDEQMSDILDGADEALLAHVATCPHCTAQVEQSRQLDLRLRATLYRWDCPPPERLSEHHLGTLEPATSRLIEEHIATCGSCRQELADLADFLAEDPGGPFEHADRMPQIAPGNLPRRSAPVLRPKAAAAMTLRGDRRGITAEGQDFDVVVNISGTAPTRASLTGQIHGAARAAWEGALAQVFIDDRLYATTIVDDVGTFSCADLPFGLAHIEIRASETDFISIPAVEIRDYDER